jgi:Uma2 family endonuclease
MRTDIVVPDGKPAFEWIDGHVVQKVSPKRDHAIVQRILATALGAWAEGRGEVGTEWRFRVTPPGEATRPLVPDIAYVSYARLAGMTHDEKQEPRTAPDAVIEVRSPDDRQSHIDEKRRVYLAAGTTLVILVDPQTAVVVAIDADTERRFTQNETLTHPALPGFEVELAPVFNALR